MVWAASTAFVRIWAAICIASWARSTAITTEVGSEAWPVASARVMRRALEYAKTFALPVVDHCEDLNLSSGGDIHEGAQSVRLGLRGIPGSSEDVMVARDLLLSHETGARIHIAHISTRNAIQMVARAREIGIPATCEVTPHHFTLTDTDIATYDGNFKMKPPLRCHVDADAAIDGIVSGVIDAIATKSSSATGRISMSDMLPSMHVAHRARRRIPRRVPQKRFRPTVRQGRRPHDGADEADDAGP